MEDAMPDAFSQEWAEVCSGSHRHNNLLLHLSLGVVPHVDVFWFSSGRA